MFIYWQDDRISLVKDTENKKDSFIMLTEPMQDLIWSPNLIYQSAIKMDTLTDQVILESNITGGEEWLKITKRSVVKMICDFDFESYPFDKQICPFHFFNVMG